jgi:hypothetical protein
MYGSLLIIAEQMYVAGQVDTSALPEALRISAIALLAIFCVMGLFGTMITLLSLMFPETNDEQE